MAEGKSTKASEEQIRYATLLNIGMIVGLAIIIVTFIIYLSGVLSSFIPPQDIPKYWGMKSKDFIHVLHTPTGWSWVAMANKGDYLNFIPIAIFAGLSIFCYLAILPILLRKKDMYYVIIALIEVAVLVLAASGIIKSGGH
jgi:hypothetical protein